MTSFAAQGWVEEDGTWYYYDKDGNRVENEWKKSGDNWFWLNGDEGGAMATDMLVEDDDDTYYVDANGVMVTNTWVKVVNEDQDDDDDPAEYRYYYMQNSGKAYKAGDSGKTKFKTIDGKKYAFDEDGKMLYGWVNEDDSTLASDDSDWETATYYMGSWEDGSLKTGWQKITVYDQDEDDDYDYWFNFKSNGKKRFNESDSKDIFEKKINGKHYAFDNRGVMTYEWTLTTTSDAATISNWLYFNSPEDGARATKGWFKVVAPDKDGDDNTFKDYSNLENPTFAKGDAEDENERWYYANSDGELYVGQIKKIKGKYYGFAPEGNKAGSMLTGLCALRVDNSGNITKLWARDMDSDDLDDAMNGEGDFDGFGSDTNDTLYYFGNNEDSDGALKTGSVSVNLDGDNYQFQFSKTGGAEGKGRGLNGIDDSKYIYKFGMKLKAGSDDKYIVVYADGDTGASDVTVHKIDTAALRRDAVERGQNKDGDTVYAYGTLGSLVSGKASSNYYLLNTSGTIVKNKTAAKDGNDWYFYVDNKVIKMYTNNNTLTGGVEDLKKDWNVESKLISDGIDGDVLDTDMVDDGI
jgi:glucan-binding YG repeat protein